MYTVDTKKIIKTYQGYLNNLSTLPVSFVYGENKYQGIGQDFKEEERVKEIKEYCEETHIRLMHKDNLLEIELVTAIYEDYGAYEWTLYFSNIGEENTQTLSSINCIDAKFSGKNPVLKGIGGDAGKLYAPYEKDLSEGEALFVSDHGRPTHGLFPYYNLEYGDGGILMTIGWPGCWQAKFTGNGDTTHVEGGLYGFESYLEPGEMIRSPLMAFVKYDKRDENVAVNVWRRWYIDCNLPKISGESYKPLLAAGTNRMTDLMKNANEKSQLSVMKRLLDNDINISYWWMDAGWYTNVNGKKISSWWDTGTWKVDTDKFPTGLASVADFGSEYGIQSILWFEPEWMRLELKAFLKENTDFDPSWLIMLDASWISTGQPWYLVNLGIPECREWVFNRVGKVIDTAKVGVYRQDFNAPPANSWRYADTMGRAGMTENLYVQGYLAYWDALIAKYPNMMLDSCASGGGRNDLETMRRSVPLTRSDYDYCNYTVRQSMIQSLTKWLPYNGSIGPTLAEANYVDKYGVRSSYCASLDLTYNFSAAGFDWDLLKECTDEFLKIKDYMLMEYYQLTEWSDKDDTWRGWQYYDPKKDEGAVQLFRDENSEVSEKQIKLYGLDDGKIYLLTDMDGLLSVNASGKELKTAGFKVILSEKRSSLVILIQGQNNE